MDMFIPKDLPIWGERWRQAGPCSLPSRASVTRFRSPPANIAVVLDSSAPEEAAAEQAGPSVEQKELLASAKPSQVLITQAFYDKIADSQPALRSSPRAGIYEYLWTSEQRLDKLQAEAEFVPTLVSGVIQPPALADTVVTAASQNGSRTGTGTERTTSASRSSAATSAFA